MDLQKRINTYGKSLTEKSCLHSKTTFDPQNADIPHLLTRDCPSMYLLVDKRNIDSCRNDYCTEILTSLGLRGVSLIKLNKILGGFKDRFPKHDECVICARRRASRYIETYRLNPKEAFEKFDHSKIIFDYVGVNGGYNK